MGHTKISATIPDEIYNDINEMASREKIKLSHLVTEALIDKLSKEKLAQVIDGNRQVISQRVFE